MIFFRVFAMLLLLSASTAQAQEQHPQAQVTQLMSQLLAEHPGKEAVVITVDYPPGGESPVHRHNAHAFVYVLEGSIVMGVRGGKTVTLKPGQTFYESPTDIHTISRNASLTKPAKFLVFLVKNSDQPIVIPAH
jgi:quercetin dioxygenase-like cupin family protein